MSSADRNKAAKRGTARHIDGTICGTLVLLLAVIAAQPAPAAPNAPTRGISFACIAVAVWDGDGPIKCRDGSKVRLSGINAREMDGSCRRGHPCPSAGPVAARSELVRLLGGADRVTADGHISVRPVTLKCRMTGGSYDRITAFCSAPAVGDLSCAMLASRTVAKWPRYWGKHRCIRRK